MIPHPNELIASLSIAGFSILVLIQQMRRNGQFSKFQKS